MGGGLRVTIVSAVVVAATCVGAAPAGAVFPGSNGLIPFSQADLVPPIGGVGQAGDLSAHSQVFTVQPNGQGLTQLTHVANDQAAGSPEFSPDGERIVYESNQSGVFRIWVMDADGDNQTQVVSEEGFEEFQPSWSPDGEKILFSRCHFFEPFGFYDYCDIAVMDANGLNVETLLSHGRWSNVRPVYSPNGHKIVFSSDRGGLQSAVWVMKADGSAPRRLTKPRLEAFWPDWAPDGSRVLFSDKCCKPDPSLWTVRPDGGGLRRLTDFRTGIAYVFPSFSPNGRRIVTFFGSDLCQCGGIRTLHADGTHRRKITNQDGFLADWGPGG